MSLVIATSASFAEKNFDERREYDYHTFSYNQLHSSGTVTTSLCTCVCFLWRTTLYYNAHILSIGNNIIAQQLMQMTSKALLVPNHNLSMLYLSMQIQLYPCTRSCKPRWAAMGMYCMSRSASPFTTLAEKISSVFLWATRHWVPPNHFLSLCETTTCL